MENARRHDLDWLRVGAFGVLILYHIGMFYVAWGWHVKSDHAPVAAVELPMKLTNGWRLPLLFLISGVALRYARDKSNPWALARRRIWVLMIPLLFGMYVICAPQAYHELVQKGIWQGGAADFYRHYIDWPWASPVDWPIITPTWNHLWYVLYVLVYSLVLIVISWCCSGRFERIMARDSLSEASFYALPVLHIGLMVLLFASVGRAQTLYGDWYNLTASFGIMTFGYLIAKQPAFWAQMRRFRWKMLATAVALSLLIVVLQNSAGPPQFQLALRILQGWCVIFALLGWGQILLNRQSALLRYLSKAIFTYYILHQTVIIMVGVPLSELGLPLLVEFSVLTTSTAMICWAGYELVARRIGAWGVLLGARNEAQR